MADPNLLSYSTLQELQGCPRKFELNKLLAHKQIEVDDEPVDFAFGHAVAAGVQDYLLNGDRAKALLACFMNWKAPYLDEKEKKRKSIYYAAFAVEKFIYEKEMLLKDWELLTFNDIPAIELSFLIELPAQKKYRGDIDAVLCHKITKKIMVLEIKTTGFSNVDEAIYKNSAQAVGYGVVLDQIAPNSTSYDVLYLVYQCGSMAWITMPFVKTRVQKALWIKDVLSDVQVLQMYERQAHFPKRGQHCFSFFKRCAHYDYCGSSNEALGLGVGKQAEVREQELRRFSLPHYQFKFTLSQILSTQMSLTDAHL